MRDFEMLISGVAFGALLQMLDSRWRGAGVAVFAAMCAVPIVYYGVRRLGY